MTETWALICGSHINAYSIVASLAAIGWGGRVVCVRTPFQSRALMDLAGRYAEVWQLVLHTSAELLPALNDRIPQSDKKVIFFTSECFLEAFRDHDHKALPNSRYFIGSSTHLDTILDRHLFYRYVKKNGLAPVPRTIPGDEDPSSAFGDRFCIRMKRSWKGLRKLAGRVKLVTSREQRRRVESTYRASGLSAEDWCYQEALSTSVRHNVSICGWHDEKHRSYFATRHALKYPDAFGNGDVTKRIKPPNGLFVSTRAVLEALDYQGPFELEFILDREQGVYRAIELNPRFWMQHGLIEAITDHELVRRYVGQDVKKASISTDKRYWVYTLKALHRLVRLDRRILRYLTDDRTVLVPPYHIALRRIGQCLLNGFEGLTAVSHDNRVSG